MNNRIIVGVSGNKTGDSALEWALEYAGAHHSEVELVHVVDDRWSILSKSLTGTALLDAEHEMRLRAEQGSETHTTLLVHPAVVEGDPLQTLVDKAQGADLLVIGTHELSRFRGLIFSTRAAHIAALSPTSVAVIPTGRELTGTGVVVGVDGSASSIAAVEFAAKEADRLQQPLKAVYAWRALTPWALEDEFEPQEPTDSDRLILSEAVAGLAEEYPDLSLELDLSPELPADALLEASAGARLLVVGTHGRHGVAKLWLGSVSHELILAMPCPVVVIKPPAPPER